MSDQTYEIQRIEKARSCSKRRCKGCAKCEHQYLLKWVGYTPDHNSWEPAETCENPSLKWALIEFQTRIKEGECFLSPGMTLDKIPDPDEPSSGDEEPSRTQTALVCSSSDDDSGEAPLNTYSVAKARKANRKQASKRKPVVKKDAKKHSKKARKGADEQKAAKKDIKKEAKEGSKKDAKKAKEGEGNEETKEG